jgi:transcription elongation factor SPT4
MEPNAGLKSIDRIRIQAPTKYLVPTPPTNTELRQIDAIVRAGAAQGRKHAQEQQDEALARRLQKGPQTRGLDSALQELPHRPKPKANELHESELLEKALALLDPVRFSRHVPSVRSPSAEHHRKQFADPAEDPEKRVKAHPSSPCKLVSDPPYVKENSYGKSFDDTAGSSRHRIPRHQSPGPRRSRAVPKKKNKRPAKLESPKPFSEDLTKDFALRKLKPGTLAAIISDIGLQERIAHCSGSSKLEKINITADMSNEQLEPRYNQPHQTRTLRACMVCTIILPQSTFRDEGCPNCEQALELRGNSEAVTECTSSNFSGTLALMNPERSWVGKWQRLEGYVPGVYAVQVIGTLSEERIEDVRAAGMRYVPRDGRKEDEEDIEM